jgi:hypothetical protein
VIASGHEALPAAAASGKKATASRMIVLLHENFFTEGSMKSLILFCENLWQAGTPVERYRSVSLNEKMHPDHGRAHDQL